MYQISIWIFILKTQNTVYPVGVMFQIVVIAIYYKSPTAVP